MSGSGGVYDNNTSTLPKCFTLMQYYTLKYISEANMGLSTASVSVQIVIFPTVPIQSKPQICLFRIEIFLTF